MTTHKAVSAEALAALAFYLGNPSAWEGVSGTVEAAVRGVSNSARPISSADVAAWLVAQRAALNLPDSQLTVYCTGYFPDKVTWMAECKGIEFQTGDTMEEAVAKVRANIKSPKDKVEALRAQATELIRQADELAAKLEPAHSFADTVAEVKAVSERNDRPRAESVEVDGRRATIRFHLDGVEAEANYLRVPGDGPDSGFFWVLDEVSLDENVEHTPEKIGDVRGAALDRIKNLPNPNSEAVAEGARAEAADDRANRQAIDKRRHS